MFDETTKAKDIFWEEFQGTGMSHEIFDVLFDSAIEKLRRNLTSHSSGREKPRMMKCFNCGGFHVGDICPQCHNCAA